VDNDIESNGQTLWKLFIKYKFILIVD